MANKKSYIKKDKITEIKKHNGKVFNKYLQLWKKENNKTNNEFLDQLNLDNKNDNGLIRKWKNGKRDITNSSYFYDICKLLNIPESEFIQTRKIIVTPPLQLIPYNAIEKNFSSDYQAANFVINNINTVAFYNITEIKSEIAKCDYATDENIKALLESYSEFDKRDTLEYFYNNEKMDLTTSWLIFNDPFDNYSKKIASIKLIQSLIDNVYIKIIDKLEIRNIINDLPSDNKKIIYPEFFYSDLYNESES